MPHAIAQGEKQYLGYNTTAYVTTAYATTTQSLVIRTGKRPVKMYSSNPGPAKHLPTDGSVVFGPYTDIATDRKNPRVHIQLENNNAPLTVVEYTRFMEVSHWGDTLTVEDHFDLHHDGAAVTPHFSRVDATMQRKPLADTAAVTQFEFVLPLHANEVYYRDLVGNISTSKLSTRGNIQLLELRPRFPLFGGWRFQWHHGYTRPLYEVMRQASSSEFVLKVPLVDVGRDWSIEHATVQILLPEGAENVRVTLPNGWQGQAEVDMGRVATYLDWSGRTAVWIRKQHLVDEHAGDVEITYELGWWGMLRKPWLVTQAVLGVFMLRLLLSRLDFSLARK